MKRILNEADNLLSDYRSEHSEFQMAHFIVGGQGDQWAQYRQVLRELAGRHAEIKKQIQAIDTLRQKIDHERHRWFGRGKIKSLEENLTIARNAFKPKAREYFFFYKIARDLKRQIGEVPPQRRRKLDAEMWVEKARRMAAVDFLSIGGLQRSTVEFIVSFPRDMRRQILCDLRPENIQKLLSILD